MMNIPEYYKELSAEGLLVHGRIRHGKIAHIFAIYLHRKDEATQHRLRQASRKSDEAMCTLT